MNAFSWQGPSKTGAALSRRIKDSATSTNNVEKARKAGKDYSTIHGLSSKPHGGAYCRAVPSKGGAVV